jgi:hypothetical protein
MSETEPLRLMLHRAVELAVTGKYADWNAVAVDLTREGYGEAGAVLAQYAVRVQLDSCLRAARRGQG